MKCWCVGVDSSVWQMAVLHRLPTYRGYYLDLLHGELT